ncbi:MAG: hypothetical protein ABIE74_06895 [Pseudomonadota bacterium]
MDNDNDNNRSQYWVQIKKCKNLKEFEELQTEISNDPSLPDDSKYRRLSALDESRRRFLLNSNNMKGVKKEELERLLEKEGGEVKDAAEKEIDRRVQEKRYFWMIGLTIIIILLMIIPIRICGPQIKEWISSVVAKFF